MSIELLPTRLRVKQYPCDLGERRRIGLLGPVSGGRRQTGDKWRGVTVKAERDTSHCTQA